VKAHYRLLQSPVSFQRSFGPESLVFACPSSVLGLVGLAARPYGSEMKAPSVRRLLTARIDRILETVLKPTIVLVLAAAQSLYRSWIASSWSQRLVSILAAAAPGSSCQKPVSCWEGVLNRADLHGCQGLYDAVQPEQGALMHVIRAGSQSLVFFPEQRDARVVG